MLQSPLAKPFRDLGSDFNLEASVWGQALLNAVPDYRVTADLDMGQETQGGEGKGGCQVGFGILEPCSARGKRPAWGADRLVS